MLMAQQYARRTGDVMKKFLAVILLACIMFSPVVQATPAHAGALWDFLWDQAKDAAISYAINHADEIVSAISSAFSDSSSNSNASYYSRRIVADAVNVREEADI